MVHSYLESLPAELRIQILLELKDLFSLRSLVYASPSYHASYIKVGREKVLSRLALQQHPDHVLDADALATARSAKFYDKITRGLGRPGLEADRANAFLDEYGRARGDNVQLKSKWLSHLGITETIDLIHLHRSVKRVTSEYCVYIGCKMKPKQRPLRLSQMEEIRLHRAIYRFQIYCNLFGHNPFLPPTNVGDNETMNKHPIRQFLPSFPPWEVLEIACVWHFLVRRWARVIREGSDVECNTKTRPNEDGGLQDAFVPLEVNDDCPSDGSSLEEDDPWLNEYTRTRCEYLAHLGPHFLAKTLAKGRKEGRHDALKAMRDRFTKTIFQPFDNMHEFPGPLEDFIFPADKYQDPEIVNKLSHMPEPQRPSDGWQWFCQKHGIQSLEIGPGVYRGEAWFRVCQPGSDNDLALGFPFWDKEKLKMLGVIDEKEGEEEEEGVREA